MQFCDAWAFGNLSLEMEFRDSKVPYLSLDREYILGGTGQMRTRVQAFLETIEGGR